MVVGKELIEYLGHAGNYASILYAICYFIPTKFL